MRGPLRLIREECGAELVEFAITAWLLLLALFGVIGAGLAMYTYHFVSYSAQMGARYAMVHGADWPNSCATQAPPSFVMSYGCKASIGDVQNYVQSLATGGILANNVVVTANWLSTTPGGQACAPESQGCLVQVKVTYAFPFLSLPFLPSSALSMSSTAEQVIQQ
jgi:Flp pilus assembly protein TadG